MPATPFPWPQLAVGWGLTSLAMAGLWWRQLRTRDATAVDAAWAAAIGLQALAAAATGTGAALPRALAAGVAAVWSARLAGHLLGDRVGAGRGEDGRYAALRRRLGPRAGAGFLGVYLVQAVLAAAFALPFVLLANDPEPSLRPLPAAGLLLFAGGLAVTAVADRQLAAHRRDPGQRGRTCRRGLWRWSRHPNYFGEWLQWCGIAALASPAPHGAVAWAVPLLLYLLVRYVTGIPFTEQQALRSRGDDYRAYQASTNAFFPGPPRAAAPR